MHPKTLRAKLKTMTLERMIRLYDRDSSVVRHWLMNPEKKTYKEPPRDIKTKTAEFYAIYTAYVAFRAAFNLLPLTTRRLIEELAAETEEELEEDDS
jgi:hypothetical protein